MATIITLIGLPGSGKSTYAKKFVEKHPDFVVLSSDEIRKEIYGDESAQEGPRVVFAELFVRLVHCAAKNVPVIIDATSLTKWERGRILEVGGRHVAVFLDVSVDECLRRNKLRDRVVPPMKLVNMAGRLEPPMEDEGYAKVFVVS